MEYLHCACFCDLSQWRNCLSVRFLQPSTLKYLHKLISPESDRWKNNFAQHFGRWRESETLAQLRAPQDDSTDDLLPGTHREATATVSRHIRGRQREQTGRRRLAVRSVATRALQPPGIQMSHTQSEPLSLDDDSLDSPSIDKAELLAALAAAGLPSSLLLETSQTDIPGLGPVRTRLTTQCGEGPGLLEFEGSLLAPIVPSALHDWPAWYIRLPDAWLADVPRLVAQTALSSHLVRHDWDHWYVGQWVAIVSECVGDDWFASCRRVEVDDRTISWTLSKGAHSGGVLALIECAGTISVTAYPIDARLVCGLQAGDGASSRHPLFDLSLEAVQAMTRATEDGETPVCQEHVVRLPVVRAARTGGQIAMDSELLFNCEVSLPLGPRVSFSVHDDGEIGRLQDIFAWLPAAWQGGTGSWLRLNIPCELHDSIVRSAPHAAVTYVAAEDDAPAMMLVTLANGPELYVAELRLDAVDMQRAVKGFAAAGRCRLALVNVQNGRPFALEVEWPKLNFMPCNGTGAVHTLGQDIFEAPEHPAVRRQAQVLALELGETVRMHRCLVKPPGQTNFDGGESLVDRT